MWTIDYGDTLQGIEPSRLEALQSKVRKLKDTPFKYGKPLYSFNDKDLKACFELKASELRIIYHYVGSTIKILAIDERGKHKVYNEARKALRRGR